MVRVIPLSPPTTLDNRPWLTLEALYQYDGQPQHHGHHLRFICPLEACTGRAHSNDPHSLSVDEDSGAWKCHSCGAAGQLEDFRAPTSKDKESWRDRERAKAYKAMFPTSSRQAHSTAPVSESQQKIIADVGIRYDQYGTVAGTPGADYLTSRSIPVELAEASGVRYGELYKRAAVIFPIRDADGQLVALNGRFLTVVDKQRKTQSAGPISMGVFMTPGALSAPQVAICEAACDALSLAAAGLPAVALIGTSSRPAWLRIALARATIVIAMDADVAGDTAAKSLAAWLCFGPVPNRLRPPEAHKDWNGALQALGLGGLAALLPLAAGKVATVATPEEQLAEATLEYERRYRAWIALYDAGRRAEASAIIEGAYFAAGERMAALSKH
jgi:Toprim-like